MMVDYIITIVKKYFYYKPMVMKGAIIGLRPIGETLWGYQIDHFKN